MRFSLAKDFLGVSRNDFRFFKMIDVTLPLILSSQRVQSAT